MEHENITALVVAAGSGSRMGGEVPKQYRKLGPKTVLAHAVDAMTSHERIRTVRVVIGPDQEELAREALGDRDVGDFIIGGAQRSDSVRAGLAVIHDGIVLIHDAARPFCPADVIDRLLEGMARGDGCVPVLAVSDTLATGTTTLDAMVARERLLRVQTPQAFHVEDLLYAFDEYRGPKATDESSILVAAGLKVVAVEGDSMLEKLTTQSDWDRARSLVEAKFVSRTGMGFDVHAFEGQGPVVMGGIQIPHERGLAGHSDADVVLHSITDAILGAIAQGDIGTHFPPSEPKWKGASSDHFLRHAAGLVRDAGGFIDHVDCTVICEAPKIGPYRESMRARVAEILGISPSRVSIKATTTEQLGFTGRREGIAAQAVASIRMEISQ